MTNGVTNHPVSDGRWRDSSGHRPAGTRGTGEGYARVALPSGRREPHTLTDIGKIRAVPRPSRITGPLLDVSACLLRARNQGETVHGWALMKATKRSGPTVYGVLDRLEDCGWITGYWEELGPDSGRPRRRFYQLTPEGVAGVEELLLERRPQELRDIGGRSPGRVLPRLAPGGAA